MLKIISANLWNNWPVNQLTCKLTNPLFSTFWATNMLFCTYHFTQHACWVTWHVISDEPNCMLSYMHVRLHEIFHVSQHACKRTCHAIFRWTHPWSYGWIRDIWIFSDMIWLQGKTCCFAFHNLKCNDFLVTSPKSYEGMHVHWWPTMQHLTE